ncbi:hypothetical protein NP493_1336g01013 [Ridgeia piscesae]|uniref:Uncharacterized protein n=1 Tax=Ridgeia piscesae TaxID=27915 RepID=A0AAD9K778_RIDPI|nr:hypothetical protein NP493_1336g01013 [Ridgeia piscesae]
MRRQLAKINHRVRIRRYRSSTSSLALWRQNFAPNGSEEISREIIATDYSGRLPEPAGRPTANTEQVLRASPAHFNGADSSGNDRRDDFDRPSLFVVTTGDLRQTSPARLTDIMAVSRDTMI